MAAKRVELCKSLSFLHGRSNELIIHSVIRVQSSLETSLFQLGGVIEQTKSKVGGVGCSSMIFINMRKKSGFFWINVDLMGLFFIHYPFEYFTNNFFFRCMVILWVYETCVITVSKNLKKKNFFFQSKTFILWAFHGLS